MLQVSKNNISIQELTPENEKQRRYNKSIQNNINSPVDEKKKTSDTAN